MCAMRAATSLEQATPCPSEQLAMQMLKLVTEVMVDDVSLGEQIRTAIMTIWLAERRIDDPQFCWAAFGDIQRGEQKLRRQLYRALRCGYVDHERFDEAMSLLDLTAVHRLSCLSPAEPLALPS